MSSMSPFIKRSRQVALGVGVFFTMSAVGGFPLGIILQRGDYLAMACMSAGIALASALWWIFAKEPSYLRNLNYLLLVSFVGTAGLALYGNLIFAVWALGLPLQIGAVVNGQMGPSYWLGPATLLYAVLCYISLKTFAKKSSS